MKCPNCGTEVGEDARFCTNCGVALLSTVKEEGATPLYCKKCGLKLPEGAAFCTKCGNPVATVPPITPVARTETRIILASWGERFVAWLLDIIIIGIVLAPLKWLAIWPAFVWAPAPLRWIPFADFGLDNLIYLLYWTLMEGSNGQSLGKMIMKIKVTRLNGAPTDIAHAALQSLGKAFLLPIDCLIGWILYPLKNQRLFNYLSETIVVKA